MKITCTKHDAAVRQIDVAIGLLLTDGDPLAVRTLGGAAYLRHSLYFDVIQHEPHW